MKRNEYRRMAAATAALLALISTVGVAQRGQTSALTGVVRDATDAPLVGVAITASSPQLIGGAIVTATNAEGAYRFLELLPGEYSIRVEHPGFKTLERPGVELVPGGAVTLDWTLQVAGTNETVEVRAPSPMVDVRTAAAPNRLTSGLLQDLPVTRSIVALANLTPGIVAEVPLGASANSFTASFDGTPTSRPTTGSADVLPVFHAIQELQVTASGAGAEYGDFTGVQTNVILRSGGNTHSGLGEYRTRRPSWVGDNRKALPRNLQERFRPTEIIADWDLAGSAGGPILRDKVWYFAGYQHVREDTRPSGFVNLPRRPDDPVASSRDSRWIGKLTAAASSQLRIEAFYQHNRQRWLDYNASPFIAKEAISSSDAVQHAWNARLLWSPAVHTFVTLTHGGYRDDYYEGPESPAGPPGRYDLVTSLTSVNSSWFFDSRVHPITTAASMTRVVDRALGVIHELKIGVEHQLAAATERYGFPGGMFFYDADGVPQEVQIQTPVFTRPRQQHFAFYAQDRWQVSRRVTLEPGLRVGFNRGRVHGGGTVFATNPVSPRIGIAWDVTPKHKTVLRAHYGRYHDALLTAHYGFMDPLGSPLFTVARVLGPNDYQTISTSGGPDNVTIDPDVSHSFADGYLAGLEHELFPDFSLRAQYLRRSFENFLAFVDPLSTYEPAHRPDPGPDGRLGTPDDRGSITVFERQNDSGTGALLTNVDAAYRRYQAVQIIGTKRYSRNWELQASYTWSRARGNVNNLGGTNAASNGLGRNGIFANPNALINMDGVPSHDYPEQVKVLSTVRLPYWSGFNIGAVYRYYSGRAWGRRITVTGLRQGSENIRVEPIGTYRMPATNQLDLRLEKTWRAGGSRSLGVFADVLNVNNQGTSRFVTEGSGPSFGFPGQWTIPRSLRVGGRMTF